MNLMKLSLYCSLLILLTGIVKAQNITDAQKDAIQKLLEDWKSTDPGISISILHQQDTFHIAAGLENLTSNKKVDSKTPFRIGGMAKHFTAIAILYLESQGRIGLQDDIRKYLPELPKQDHVITIEHLLHHTSGLPRYWALKSLAGYRDDVTFTSTESMTLYKQNWEIESSPGTAFSFSATGSALIPKIISKVTGISFAQFTRQELFEPMGMAQTYFIDENTDPNRVPKSYDLNQNEIALRHLDPGPAGLVTSTEDVLKWIQNLKSGSIGNQKMRGQINELVLLENGIKASSSNGQLTLGQQFYHLERGLPKIWDFGALGGFASSIFHFPQQDFTVITCSKSGVGYNGYFGMQIADILLQDHYEKESEFEIYEPEYISLDEKMKENIVGYYFNPVEMTIRQINSRNDTLRYYRAAYDSDLPIVPISKTAFHLVTPYDKFDITFKQESNIMMMALTIEENTYEYEKFEPRRYNVSELESYTGIFYSTQLMQIFSIYAESGKLYLENKDYGKIELLNFKKDQFLANSPNFKMVNFQKNDQDILIGLSLDDASFKNIHFDKINENGRL